MSNYIPDLPGDVLACIFLRLPAKTVLDCRCVCKLWYYVVSNSIFISDYNRRSLKSVNDRNYTHFIMSHYDVHSEEVFTLHLDDNRFINQNEELDMPFVHGLSNYITIGLCCGLACMLEISKAEKLPLSLLIWNPSVDYSFKTFSIPPPIGRLVSSSSLNGPSIRFSDGNVWFFSSFGFGFDPKSNDYKVVRIVYRMDEFFGGIPEIVDVFALSTGEWKDITASAPSYVIKENSVPVYVNGAMHWIGFYMRNDSESSTISRLIVAVFDMGNEVFNQFQLPDGVVTQANELGDDSFKVSVGVIDQSLTILHYISYSNGYYFRKCCIWVMNEYGAKDSWSLLYDVKLFFDIGRIIGVRRNGHILVGAAQDKELLSVNPNYNSTKPLGLRGNALCFYADPYMECLIIYKKVNGVPRMSISSAATSSQRDLIARTSELKITDKGKEMVE
ncbi:F-box protein [Melia azedarach]|uniref:F-box protein n=1 Tax=Melia azedarach TaxID=155640 RepID=A0ACC1XXR3_MELAZ|nr:F-box protein [Melia azedarach]